jgi:ADP-heptose:LPS heptosyltransferase
VLRLLDSIGNVGAARTAPLEPLDRVHPKRILVLELWNIGDVVLSMPFLSRLRALFPDATVTLLGRPHAREILRGTGLVDDFVDLAMEPAGSWTRGDQLWTDWRQAMRACSRIRQTPPDIGFQSRLHIREQILLAMCGARRRVGYGFGDHRGLLTDVVRVGDPNDHRVGDWLGLLDGVGRIETVSSPRLSVSDDERHWSDAHFKRAGLVSGEILVGIHPGASVVEKRWPLENFRRIAIELSQRPGIRVVVFADPEGYGSQLCGVPGVICARARLRELVALIERCDLVVGNDSGPMHIASALGVSTVAVFASGIPQGFAPLGENHASIVADSPAAVEVSEVLNAIDRQLAQEGARSSAGDSERSGPRRRGTT